MPLQEWFYLLDGHLLVSLLLLIVQLDVFFQGFLRINLRHADIGYKILLKVYFCFIVCLFLFQNFNNSNYMFFIVTSLNFQITVKNATHLQLVKLLLHLFDRFLQVFSLFLVH